jgi:hypothetical protein
MSFGPVGQYEKLAGRAYGEVDPGDPRNAVVTDIGLAPRNAGGKVEYSMDRRPKWCRQVSRRECT